MAYALTVDIANRLRGLLAQVVDEPVIRGATAGGKDRLEHMNVETILAVTRTPKGAQAPDAPDFASTKYQISSSSGTKKDQIDWSPSGSPPTDEPVAGTEYYVSYEYYANKGGADDVTDAIKRADSRINIALAARYTVPLSGVSLLKELSISIASFYIAPGVFEGEVPDPHVKAYEDAIKTLEALAEGEMQLVDDSGVVLGTSTSFGVLSNTSAFVPTFDLGEVIDQEVDPNYLSDLATSKS
jgi:phage gp36-like protein